MTNSDSRGDRATPRALTNLVQFAKSTCWRRLGLSYFFAVCFPLRSNSPGYTRLYLYLLWFVSTSCLTTYASRDSLQVYGKLFGMKGIERSAYKKSSSLAYACWLDEFGRVAVDWLRSHRHRNVPCYGSAEIKIQKKSKDLLLKTLRMWIIDCF